MVAPMPDYDSARRKQEVVRNACDLCLTVAMVKAAEQRRVARAFAPLRTLTNADGDRAELSTPSQADSDPRGWTPVREVHKPLWGLWCMVIGAGFILAATAASPSQCGRRREAWIEISHKD